MTDSRIIASDQGDFPEDEEEGSTREVMGGLLATLMVNSNRLSEIINDIIRRTGSEIHGAFPEKRVRYHSKLLDAMRARELCDAYIEEIYRIRPELRPRLADQLPTAEVASDYQS